MPKKHAIIPAKIAEAHGHPGVGRISLKAARHIRAGEEKTARSAKGRVWVDDRDMAINPRE